MMQRSVFMLALNWFSCCLYLLTEYLDTLYFSYNDVLTEECNIAIKAASLRENDQCQNMYRVFSITILNIKRYTPVTDNKDTYKVVQSLITYTFMMRFNGIYICVIICRIINYTRIILRSPNLKFGMSNFWCTIFYNLITNNRTQCIVQ